MASREERTTGWPSASRSTRRHSRLIHERSRLSSQLTGRSSSTVSTIHTSTPSPTMIRLPPTGIDISQSDLQAQLQRLDFYSGLLKQGFKKQEVIRYFKERDADNRESLSGGSLDHAPSTYQLFSRSGEPRESPGYVPSTHRTPEGLQTQFASPIQSPREDVASPTDVSDTASASFTTVSEKKTYAPRQSSLLRFARAISSEASDEANNTSIPFSPRPITYRPRSKTYSYDQSERDEDDPVTRCSTADKLELENMSIHSDEIVTSTESTRTVQIVSSLRPDAEPFMPFRTRLAELTQASEDTGKSSTPSSTTSSFPSSPPETSQSPSDSREGSPTLPSMPHTPPIIRTPRAPSTTHGQSQQQFLDGSFTVYNDSVPARLQPQTPAELSRSQYLSQYNAAYTAPPGMIRSSAARQGISGVRQASGELSPTAQATMIRERRQREFTRGLRVEGRRIDRSQTNTRQPGTGPDMGVDPFNIWRDDLDADGVGEENFEEASLESMLRRMRVFSGNRRLV